VHITLWLIAGGLAIAFTIGGASQILMSKRQLRSYGAGQHWVDDFTSGHVKVIGTIKVIGSSGLILPAAFGIAPILVPLAASGLMLVMAGAVTTRFRRSEWTYMLGDLMFVGLLAFLTWGRFGIQPFA